jgi:hypothetical protein
MTADNKQKEVLQEMDDSVCKQVSISSHPMATASITSRGGYVLMSIARATELLLSSPKDLKKFLGSKP